MKYGIFTVYECPDEDTLKLDSSNPDSFDIDVNTPPGETFEEDPENVLRGSNDDIPLTPGDEISIQSSQGPNDDFRVMELEFNVVPDGDVPVTVTVTFVLENGTNVQVDRTVSDGILVPVKGYSKAVCTNDKLTCEFHIILQFNYDGYLTQL